MVVGVEIVKVLKSDVGLCRNSSVTWECFPSYSIRSVGTDLDAELRTQ